MQNFRNFEMLDRFDFKFYKFKLTINVDGFDQHGEEPLTSMFLSYVFCLVYFCVLGIWHGRGIQKVRM